MKFIHMADVHLGGWREPRMRDANSKSFVKVIDRCLSEKVDFVLIAGDLFNTAVPSIDCVKLAVEQLKRLKDAHIPVYFIAGSHDFSPSGKTMLDVIEQAGLGVNVAKGEEEDNKIRLHFTQDERTGVKMTGMIGKKGGLDKTYYEYLAREPLESESGYKIFMFHCALAELKPKGLEDMDAMPISLFPKCFDYYAGGHVHVIDKAAIAGYKNVIYPGPVFPNNFAEIEKLKQGSFVLVENDKIEHLAVVIHPIVCITSHADHKTVSEVESALRQQLAASDLANAIVTIRVAGCLKQGKPADLRWNDIFHDAYAKNAYFVMRNTNAFTSKELEVIMVKESNVEEVEDSLIRQHASQFKLTDDDVSLAKKAMQILSIERVEGEKVADFEARLNGELDNTLMKS